MEKPTLDISVVIPLLNEEESLPELIDWNVRVMNENNFTYELILIDDGSTDRSWEVIKEHSSKNPNVKGIKFRRNYGKSAALDTGFHAVSGEVVVTMDADLQDSPDEIPELRRKIKEENLDLVSGWKKKRHDPISKTIPTKLFNWATRKLSGIYLHDFNCGLKAYHFDVVKNIEVQGEMHRYIPVIAKGEGFEKIGEQVVQHQARKYGTSKFGLNRFINGFLDLTTITFVTRFGKKPMHFFGTFGTLFFVAGFVIALYLSIAKLAWQDYGMTERPLFFLGILCMIIGTQLFVTGFIAELIIRNSGRSSGYQVEERLGDMKE